MHLDDDVARAVARTRRERGIGLSAAVDELARAGLTATKVDYKYQPVSYDMGARVDLSNIADVLASMDSNFAG